MENICLGNITIDCENAVALRDFYAGLLGWTPDAIQGHPVLRGPAGLLLLFNAADFGYERPVWPEEAGKQQKQMHFDFHVDDLAAATARAQALGARLAKTQFGGGRYTTLLDPEGHPFCLCRKDG